MKAPIIKANLYEMHGYKVTGIAIKGVETYRVFADGKLIAESKSFGDVMDFCRSHPLRSSTASHN